MGRKKGKQSGDFPSKSQYALHRHTLYVDHASEANRYRNPASSSSNVLGRGLGYRNTDCNDFGGGGYWHANGTSYGGGDKWSNLFSSSSQTNRNTTCSSARRQLAVPGTNPISPTGENVNHRRSTTTIMGLSRLRSLLEERRVEDRLYDREHRLRLQRSRLFMVDSHSGTTSTSARDAYAISNSSIGGIVDQFREDRHEPGWLLSYHHDTKQQSLQPSQPSEGSITKNSIPSLQTLAAQTLGPVLPLYCAACGSEFVGKSLKSISAEILSELTISLANNHLEDWTSPFMTNGVVRAIMYSGMATGMVVRGGGWTPHCNLDMSAEDEDMKWLSDDGLLSLCPRILPVGHSRNNALDHDDDVSNSSESNHSSWEHWEVTDFDIGLNSRMLGCFHLKRLELIDIPLMHDMSTSPSPSSSGGITVQALWTLLRSCSSVTHLSLSGCFGNWEEAAMCDIEGIDVFLGGNQSISSLSRCIDILGKRHGNDVDVGEFLLPYLDFHQIFEESTDERNVIPALNSSLPDLTVLDVSHCGWVAPEMIIRLILNGWNRCFASNADGGENQHECDEEAANFEGNRKSANIYPTLRHINIRGCTRLLSGYPSQTSWMDEWRRFGLFDGIEISTDRQIRT